MVKSSSVRDNGKENVLSALNMPQFSLTILCNIFSRSIVRLPESKRLESQRSHDGGSRETSIVH